MRRVLRAWLLAATMPVVATGLITLNTPAYAQEEFGISFDSFHDALMPYGDWVYSDRWGLVWQPGDVPDDFRPYDTDGHWVYTDEYGWTWVSDYPWGDITFHYGRWVFDPDDGWLWIPGYVWSPGWVVWRSNDNYLGWMPMPPDDDFLSGRGDVSFGISFSWGGGGRDYYGYSNWYGPDFDDRRFGSMWVFVGAGHVADPDFQRYVLPPTRNITIINQTKNITNYSVVNGYVVNRSVDVHMVERVAGHPIRPVRATAVIRHPNLITTAAVGQHVRAQMVRFVPRGTGKLNSAPPPPPNIVSKLSNKVVLHGHPGAATHLFTKTTVVKPDIVSKFHGKALGSPGGTALTPNVPQPPNAARERLLHENPPTTPNMTSGPANGPQGAESGHLPPGGGATKEYLRTHHGKPSPTNGPAGEFNGPANGQTKMMEHNNTSGAGNENMMRMEHHPPKSEVVRPPSGGGNENMMRMEHHPPKSEIVPPPSGAGNENMMRIEHRPPKNEIVPPPESGGTPNGNKPENQPKGKEKGKEHKGPPQ
jgi:Family of unknown function (DUF6600)